MLGAAAGVAITFELASWVGHQLFYDKTVKPAVDYETAQVDAAGRRHVGDANALINDLANLKGAEKELYDKAFAAVGPVGWLLTTNERNVLEDQEKVLRDQLKAQGLTNEKIEELLSIVQGGSSESPRDPFGAGGGGSSAFGPPLGAGGNPLTPKEQAAGAASSDKALLNAIPKTVKLDDAGVIERLARTSEIGFAGIGTAIEQGVLTGLDPFGENMLHIFERAEFPKQGQTFGEIKNHLIALEDVQQQYLDKGDVHAAAKVQGVIDKLGALIGVVDETNAILSYQQDDATAADAALLNVVERYGQRTANKTSEVATKMEAQRAAIERGFQASNRQLGIIAAKDPNINVAAYFNADISVSATQVQRTVSVKVAAAGPPPGAASRPRHDPRPDHRRYGPVRPRFAVQHPG